MEEAYRALEDAVEVSLSLSLSLFLRSPSLLTLSLSLFLSFFLSFSLSLAYAPCASLFLRDVHFFLITHYCRTVLKFLSSRLLFTCQNAMAGKSSAGFEHLFQSPLFLQTQVEYRRSAAAGEQGGGGAHTACNDEPIVGYFILFYFIYFPGVDFVDFRSVVRL
jgi:hypothetical protein